MRFSTSALVAVIFGPSMITAFAPPLPTTTISTTISSSSTLFQSTVTQRTTAFVLQSTTEEDATTSTSTSSSSPDEIEEEGERQPRKKDARLRMMKSEQFHRKGFKEVRDSVEETMGKQFKSELVEQFKENNYVIEKNGVKVYLAKDFGFCWGVERSIALAYEAVEHFPGKKVHITNELIHNPEVNNNLQAMNVQFIEKVGGDAHKKNFDNIQDGDVVILPAFGASFEEMEMLDKKNVEIVDTTCPWVSKVWNTVDMHQKKGLTSIIHGKYAHEETVATTSFCEDYICVKDMKEAEMVTDYILNGGDKEAFMKHFEKAVSKGFDPDTMLDKVGIANQTTMYKKETRAIGQLLQKTMMKKFGPHKAAEHYYEFDTICDATQERQDAVQELVENAKTLGLDFILVVGGWDSSNTAHLLEIPVNAGVRAFHINEAKCITADNKITHRNMKGEIVTEDFLLDMSKDVVMGVTSGASTPDASVQASLGNVFMLKEVNNAKA